MLSETSLLQLETPPTPRTLRELGGITDVEAIMRLLKRSQNPPSCATARYLILDDPRGPSGFGYAFWQIFAAMLFAVTDNRVLVHGASVLDNMSWQWCGHPPRDFSCYFELWTPCIGRGSRDMLMNASVGLGGVSSHQILADSSTEERIVLARDVDRSLPEFMYNRGRYFKLPHVVWFGLVSKVLLRAHDWLDTRVDRFLLMHGALENIFVVVHVRLGQKYTEAEMPTVELYKPHILRMARCLGAKHVLVVTETQTAVDVLIAWGRTVGLHVFATSQHRHGNDVWNSDLMGNLGPSVVDMDDEGYYAIFNLRASRKAAGLVGIVSSQWAKLTDAVMFAHHGRVMPFITVVPNKDDTYYLEEGKDRIVVGQESLKWRCTHQ